MKSKNTLHFSLKEKESVGEDEQKIRSPSPITLCIIFTCYVWSECTSQESLQKHFFIELHLEV